MSLSPHYSPRFLYLSTLDKIQSISSDHWRRLPKQCFMTSISFLPSSQAMLVSLTWRDWTQCLDFSQMGSTQQWWRLCVLNYSKQKLLSSSSILLSWTCLPRSRWLLWMRSAWMLLPSEYRSSLKRKLRRSTFSMTMMPPPETSCWDVETEETSSTNISLVLSGSIC